MTPSSPRPLNKVLVSTLLAGCASALVILIAWLISLTGVEMPAGVQGALVVIFSSIGALVGGYYTPIAPGEVRSADAVGTPEARRV